MSLEGLRAWIGEVERKLAKRTRVFLALTVIAIGIAGAAAYLAIDARESSVSESDVQELQQRLEARIDELGATSAVAPVVPETAPGQEPEPTPHPVPENGTGESNKGDGGANEGASGSTPNGATGGDASAAQLQELVEKAREQAEQGK
jgi:hypothetical protein